MIPTVLRRPLLFFLLTISMGLAGCFNIELSTVSLTEADKTFKYLCLNEYKIPVTVTRRENTVWIYAPLKKSFFDIKLNPPGQMPSGRVTEKQHINFLESEFSGGTFKVRYDISLRRDYMKDQGYASAYSEAYRSVQRNILTAVSRAYTPVEAIAQEDEKVPDFFVIVIADIIRGLEGRIILHFQDLKRAMHDFSFQEEYAKRSIQVPLLGDESIVGDEQGVYLDIQDLTWPEFLAKQIAYRITYKYTYSAFSPSDDTVREIGRVAAEVLEGYNFKDFDSVELFDMDSRTSFTIHQSILKDYLPEETKKPGRFHVIEFFSNSDDESQETAPQTTEPQTQPDVMPFGN